MEVLVAISTYLMFGSKRALIWLQIATWHHRKKGRRPQIAAWYHQKGRRTLPKDVPKFLNNVPNFFKDVPMVPKFVSE